MIDKRFEDEWKQQLVKCIRCGTCRSVCPVFEEENNENTTARGKIRLLEAALEGKIDITKGVQQRFDNCLLCKACAKGCPSGVKTDELFLSARQAAAQKNGLPFIKKAAFTGLKYRALFDVGLRLGAKFQDIVLKPAPDGRGRVSRFWLPGAGLNLRRIIPPLAEKTLRSLLPEEMSNEKRAGRAAFFTGCMLNYIYPQAGLAIVEILRHNGWEVVIPKDQCCCGTPAYTSGDVETGRYLAEQNIKALSGRFDAIITGCGTCGQALKHEYGRLVGEEFKEEWQRMAGKVYDIADFVVKFGDIKNFGPVKMKVTYHDSCHLLRGMGVGKEPRKIFQAIPQLEFCEMSRPDVCCGAGGTFSLTHYQTARSINDRKLADAEATGAECLLTGCSACRMHIADGLGQRGSKMNVLHTAEIINMAYKAGQRRGE